MDCLRSGISKKIRDAIKAKLIELGIAVDDELPDYVMVLVVNRKSRQQMEDNLSLFLMEHTATFVAWLRDVLLKLQSLSMQAKTPRSPSVASPQSASPAAAEVPPVEPPSVQDLMERSGSADSAEQRRTPPAEQARASAAVAEQVAECLRPEEPVSEAQDGSACVEEAVSAELDMFSGSEDGRGSGEGGVEDGGASGEGAVEDGGASGEGAIEDSGASGEGAVEDGRASGKGAVESDRGSAEAAVGDNRDSAEGAVENDRGSGEGALEHGEPGTEPPGGDGGAADPSDAPTADSEPQRGVEKNEVTERAPSEDEAEPCDPCGGLSDGDRAGGSPNTVSLAEPPDQSDSPQSQTDRSPVKEQLHLKGAETKSERGRGGRSRWESSSDSEMEAKKKTSGEWSKHELITYPVLGRAKTLSKPTKIKQSRKDKTKKSASKKSKSGKSSKMSSKNDTEQFEGKDSIGVEKDANAGDDVKSINTSSDKYCHRKYRLSLNDPNDTKIVTVEDKQIRDHSRSPDFRQSSKPSGSPELEHREDGSSRDGSYSPRCRTASPDSQDHDRDNYIEVRTNRATASARQSRSPDKRSGSQSSSVSSVTSSSSSGDETSGSGHWREKTPPPAVLVPPMRWSVNAPGAAQPPNGGKLDEKKSARATKKKASRWDSSSSDEGAKVEQDSVPEKNGRQERKSPDRRDRSSPDIQRRRSPSTGDGKSSDKRDLVSADRRERRSVEKYHKSGERIRKSEERSRRSSESNHTHSGRKSPGRSRRSLDRTRDFPERSRRSWDNSRRGRADQCRAEEDAERAVREAVSSVEQTLKRHPRITFASDRTCSYKDGLRQERVPRPTNWSPGGRAGSLRGKSSPRRRRSTSRSPAPRRRSTRSPSPRDQKRRSQSPRRRSSRSVSPRRRSSRSRSPRRCRPRSPPRCTGAANWGQFHWRKSMSPPRYYSQKRSDSQTEDGNNRKQSSEANPRANSNKRSSNAKDAIKCSPEEVESRRKRTVSGRRRLHSSASSIESGSPRSERNTSANRRVSGAKTSQTNGVIKNLSERGRRSSSSESDSSPARCQQSTRNLSGHGSRKHVVRADRRRRPLDTGGRRRRRGSNSASDGPPHKQSRSAAATRSRSPVLAPRRHDSDTSGSEASSPRRRRVADSSDSEASPVRQKRPSVVAALRRRGTIGDSEQTESSSDDERRLSSTVRVTERPQRPVHLLPKPAILVKAMQAASESAGAATQRPVSPAPQPATRKQQQLFTRDLRQSRAAPAAPTARGLASDRPAAAVRARLGTKPQQWSAERHRRRSSDSEVRN